MADTKLQHNKNFKYQLTNYMKKEDLAPFIEPFTADKKWENLHYVIKKDGRSDRYAIFTKGSYVIMPSVGISRREAMKK